jgi:hypothetical protein
MEIPINVLRWICDASDNILQLKAEDFKSYLIRNICANDFEFMDSLSIADITFEPDSLISCVQISASSKKIFQYLQNILHQHNIICFGYDYKDSFYIFVESNTNYLFECILELSKNNPASPVFSILPKISLDQIQSRVCTILHAIQYRYLHSPLPSSFVIHCLGKNM